MIDFTLYLGTTVIFRPNALELLSSEIKKKDINNVFIITDKGIVSTGLIQRVRKWLDENGIYSEVYDNVDANPTIFNVNEAFNLFSKSDSLGIVAIGGGSSIDTAKAVALLATNGGKIEDYFGAFKVNHTQSPLFAVPTTAGTGSEVSTQISIKDEKTNIKHAIRSYNVIPSVAILDPSLLSTLPFRVALETSLDTLVHLIEGFVSKGANPFTDALALRGLELIGRSIIPFIENRSNIEAASDMMSASMLGGFILSNARTGAAHTITRPLGEGISHGLANAIVLPYVMEFNLESNVKKFAQIAKLLGAEVKGESIENDAKMAISYVKKLNEYFGIPLTLRAVGISEDIHNLAKSAYKMDISKLNPRELGIKEIEEILFEVL
jgi:alcohol dehydrogenase